MMDGPAHILLVDDDESFLKFLATVLRDEYHHRIATAQSGEEAIDILRNGKSFFDMMFLDYFMPGLTGIDVLRWMKEQGLSTPVVVLTGAGNEQVAVEAMKLGAYDYLRKEEIDIPHLGTVITATKERRLFRISKELEEEQAKEVILNAEATDKLRKTLNSLTPALNSAFAAIAVELEVNGERMLKDLPDGPRKESLRSVLREIQTHVGVLETGIKTLLRLYQLVYAHHDMAPEIELMKKEVEEKINPSERVRK